MKVISTISTVNHSKVSQILTNTLSASGFFQTNFNTVSPFTGPHFTGWYLVSVPDPSENGILDSTDDPFQTIFQKIYDIKDKRLILRAFIDHSNLNKLKNPNVPLDNNGIIETSKWTNVIGGISGETIVKSNQPNTLHQTMYGHLGYFAYLVYMFFNLNNMVFAINFNISDPSYSNFTISSKEIQPTGEVVSDVSKGYATSAISLTQLEWNKEYVKNTKFSNLSEIKFKSAATFENGTLTIPFENFLSAPPTLNFIQGPDISYLLAADFTALKSNPSQIASLEILSGHLTLAQGVKLNPDNLNVQNIMYKINEIPNSYLDFKVMGVILTFSDNEFAIAFNSQISNSVTYKPDGVLVTKSRLQSIVEHSSENHSLFINSNNDLTVNGIISTYSNIGYQSNSNSTTTSFYPNVKTTGLKMSTSVKTINNTTKFAHQAKNLIFFIQPTIILNGGFSNQLNNGTEIPMKLGRVENTTTTEIFTESDTSMFLAGVHTNSLSNASPSNVHSTLTNSVASSKDFYSKNNDETSDTFSEAKGMEASSSTTHKWIETIVKDTCSGYDTGTEVFVTKTNFIDILKTTKTDETTNHFKLPIIIHDSINLNVSTTTTKKYFAMSKS